MSWLARSIANSLRIDDGDDRGVLDFDGGAELLSPSPSDYRDGSPLAEDRESGPDGGDLRGVKEDLSEFRESVTRQLWGVANFLAPPPPSPPPPSPPGGSDHPRGGGTESTRPESVSGDDEYDDDDDHTDNEDKQAQINYELRNVAGGGGGGDDDDDDEEEEMEEGEGDDDWLRDVAGLTEEVLAYTGNVAHHPETWLDFPVEDDEDFEDFPMSESQIKHTQAVELLTPRLAALRIELCPAHMSAGFFWKVYFVLLHSRLNKQDADLLSTPEVVEARAKWMQELQNRAKIESERYHVGQYGSADFDEDITPRSQQNEHSETLSSRTFASEPGTSSTTADSDTEKHVVSSEIRFTDKSILDDKPSLVETNDKNEFAAPIYKRPVLHFDDDEDDDDWPEDDCLEQNGKVIPFGIDDDISFSDLEDDDCCIPVISKSEFKV